MTIHHATIKRATANGVILTELETDTGTMVQALWPEMNQRIEHSDAKVALNAVLLMRSFKHEYPALALEFAAGEFWVYGNVGTDIPVVLYQGIELPDLADVLDAAQEQGVDPEVGYEEKRSRVVVPAKYKREYTERGNRDHCGDWIAKKLDGLFDNEQGMFDADAFEAFLRLNDVDMSGKWADLPVSGQRGWVGRYRMNGRQKLEMRITKVGYFLYNNGDEVQKHEAPVAYLQHLAEKHPKVTPEWGV